MTWKFVLTFIGWAFTLIPLCIFLLVSARMIKGAASDDGMIMALTMIGLSIFMIGVALLVLLYLTAFI